MVRTKIDKYQILKKKIITIFFFKKKFTTNFFFYKKGLKKVNYSIKLIFRYLKYEGEKG